jgi:hypothetical protein
VLELALPAPPVALEPAPAELAQGLAEPDLEQERHWAMRISMLEVPGLQVSRVRVPPARVWQCRSRLPCSPRVMERVLWPDR